MSEAKNESSANGATSNDLLGVFAAVSEWRHTNGNLYHVLCIANEHTERPDQYPVTVVYQGDNGRIWSRPLSDWHRSMTPNAELRCAPSGASSEQGERP